MHLPIGASIPTRIIGDDWFFPYQLFDAPEDVPTVAAPASGGLSFYSPPEPVSPPIVNTAALTPSNLTGFTPQAFLLQPGQKPIEVITDAQSETNLLQNGQFTIIVPRSITALIPAEQFGSRAPSCRLQVTYIDPRGYVSTVETVELRVAAP